MISLEETKKIAALAKLDLSEAELKRYQQELSGILSYVDIITQAPDPKEKLSSPVHNMWREDEIKAVDDFSVSLEAKKIYGFKKTDDN